MKTILLIDDQIEVATFVAELLSMQGYEVEVAVGAVDGLIQMFEKPYSAIICDHHMPIKLGTELAEGNFHKSPFILMTGETDLASEKFPGVDLVLLKPFDGDTLEQAVKQVSA